MITDYKDFIDAPITYIGTKYKPLSNREVIETLEEKLDKDGIEIKNKLWNVANKGQQIVGRYELFDIDGEMGFELSFKNSLDGSMAFGIASGTKTYICKNGAVFGDSFMYKRRHVGNSTNEILNAIDISIDSFNAVRKLHLEKKEQYKNIVIDEQDIQHMVGQLFMAQDILKVNQLSILREQILKPSYDYKADGSLYELFSHSTRALRDTNPREWHVRHKALHEFYDGEYGL